MANQTTAITATNQTGVEIARDLTSVQSLAEAFTQSGMFTDIKSKAQAIVKIVAGSELGLPPVYSMQNINLIRNRLTTSANTMAMLVKKSGRYNYRIKKHDEQECSIAFYEIENDKWVEVGDSTFTMKDATKADLVKPESGWAKYPRAMLFSRAISQGARIYAPDAIGGIYTDEEIRSIPPKPEDQTEVSYTSENAPPASETASGNVTGQPEQKEVTGMQSTLSYADVQNYLSLLGWKETTMISRLRSVFKLAVESKGENTLRVAIEKLTGEQAEKVKADLEELVRAAGK